MQYVAITALGDLVLVHQDEPAPDEVRRRVQMLLYERLPKSGLLLVWKDKTTHQVRWRPLA